MRKIIQKVKSYNIHSGYIKWLIKYSIPYLPQITLIFVMNIVCSLISAQLAVVSKNIIDSAIGGNLVLKAIGIYVIMILIDMLFSAAVSFVSVILEEKFSFGIRKNLYEKIIQSNWVDIKKYHSGDMMTRMTSDAGNISNGIIYTIPNIFRLIIEVLVMFFVLYYY